MLHSSIGNTILNGLFAKLGGTIISFNGDVYLGLLTKMPNDNGDAHEDGTYFSEPADVGYFRVRLDTNSRISKAPFIAPAVADTPITTAEGDRGTPAYVTNQALIMFPESNNDWDTIVGFGLFRAKSGADLPFLWGSVTSKDGEEGVTVAEHEVPVIRPGDFKVSLV